MSIDKNKASSLYQALKSNGISEEQIGREAEFIMAMEDDKKARGIYQNIKTNPILPKDFLSTSEEEFISRLNTPDKVEQVNNMITAGNPSGVTSKDVVHGLMPELSYMAGRNPYKRQDVSIVNNALKDEAGYTPLEKLALSDSFNQVMQRRAYTPIPKAPEQTDQEYQQAEEAAIKEVNRPRTVEEIDSQINEIEQQNIDFIKEYENRNTNPDLKYKRYKMGDRLTPGKMFVNNSKEVAENEKYLSENKKKYEEITGQINALKLQSDLTHFTNQLEAYNPDDSAFKKAVDGAFKTGKIKDFATFGLTEIGRLVDINQLYSKAHKGELLLPEEKKVLIMNENLRALQSMDRGAFDFGIGFQKTLGFMRDMFLTGGLTGGLRAGIGKAFKVGFSQASKGFGRKLGALALYDAAVTPIMPAMYTEFMRRTNDQYTAIGDENSLTVNKEEVSLGERLYKSYATTFSERFTESLGTMFSAFGALKAIDNTKLGRKFLGNSVEKLAKMRANPNYQKVSQVLAMGGVNEVPMEIFEEVINAPLQSFLLWEKEPIQQLSDPRFYRDVALQSAIIGGAASILNYSAAGIGSQIEKRKVDKSFTKIAESFLNYPLEDERLIDARNNLSEAVNNKEFLSEDGGVEGSRVSESIIELEKLAQESGDISFLESAENFISSAHQRFGLYTALEGIATMELGNFVYAPDKSKVVIGKDDQGNDYYITDQTGDLVSATPFGGGASVSIAKSKLVSVLDVDKDQFISEWYVGRGEVGLPEVLENVAPEEPEVAPEPETGFVNGQKALYDGIVVTIGHIFEDGDAIVKNPEGGENTIALKDLKPYVEEASPVDIPAPEMSPDLVVPDPMTEAQTQIPPVPEEAKVPLQKDGTPDFDTMLSNDVNMFATEWEKMEGEEQTIHYLTKHVDNLQKKIDKKSTSLEKETSPNKIFSLKKEIQTLSEQRDKVQSVLSDRYSYDRPSQQVENPQTGLSPYQEKVNRFISSVRSHNAQTEGKRKRVNLADFNRKANELGMTIQMDGSGNIRAFDRENNEMKRLFARKQSKVEIDAHPALSDYSPEIQQAVNDVYSVPEAILNSNEWTGGRDVFIQGLNDAINGVKSVAANRVLDTIDAAYKNGLTFGDGELVQESFSTLSDAIRFNDSSIISEASDIKAIEEVEINEQIENDLPESISSVVVEDMPEWVFDGYESEAEWSLAKEKELNLHKNNQEDVRKTINITPEESPKSVSPHPGSRVQTEGITGTDRGNEPRGTGEVYSPVAEEERQINNELFNYFEGSISDLLNIARRKSNALIKKIISYVSKKQLSDYKRIGIDITEDFKHTIDNYSIAHVLKQHGNPDNESKRGQIAITADDFNRIDDIINHYDSIELSSTDTGLPAILYKKVNNDGTIYYVEEIRTKRKELSVVTFYKTKGSLDETVPNNGLFFTPETPPSSSLIEDKGNTLSSNKQTIDKKDISIFATAENVLKKVKVKKAEKQVDQNPSEAQKEAGNYQKGHVKLFGYDITIENSKGSQRSGVDTDGNPWSVTMNNTYGYFRGTKGKDGDHIDTFLGDNLNSERVFVVDQVDDAGAFDEHKVMLGFDSIDQAKEAYLSNYSPGWKGLGSITETSLSDFKKWTDIKTRKQKPFADYAMNANNDAQSGYGAGNTVVSTERYAELKERLRSKLGQLNAGFDPEVFAIGAEMAAYHIEAGARKFADFAKRMYADMGEAIVPYLKSFYLGAQSLPGMEEFARGTDNSEIINNFDYKSLSDVYNTTGNSQRDSGDVSVEQRSDARPILGQRRRGGRNRDKTAGSSPEIVGRNSSESDNGLFATIFGESSDNAVHRADQAVQSPGDNAGNIVGQGSSIDGTAGLHDVTGADRANDQDATRVSGSFAERSKRKLELQRKAEDVTNTSIGDLTSIEETLPFLLPEQHGDVLKAEDRFFSDSHKTKELANGKGMLFTNGTGTGKTYTGLGIIKRFFKQAIKDILIVVPTQPKVTDWVKDGKNLFLDITPLESTSSAGEGINITTYANFRSNPELMKREFGLVVYDESHRLMEDKNGGHSSTTLAHYKITNKDRSNALQRLQSFNPLWMESKELSDKLKSNKEEYSSPGTSAERKAALLEEEKTINARLNELKSLQNEALPELEEQADKAVERTKTVFLSATPFKSHFNLRYANGYLFDWGNEETHQGHSRVDAESRFFLDNFGSAYEWKYHRLQQRSKGNADAIALQEVQFAERLMANGVMSGRTINSDKDYSREFPRVNGLNTDIFNKAFSDIFNFTENQYSELRGGAREIFYNHNYSTQLFESLKTSMSIPRMQKHLELGRKVVVFHRRKQANVAPPFASILSITRSKAKALLSNEYVSPEQKEQAAAALRQADTFEASNKELLAYEQTLNYSSAISQIQEAFGDRAVYINGDVSKKNKNEAIQRFNTDGSGVDLIVVQEESGKEGISLHDTTGKHQRVLMNMSMPVSSITALQIEGRIYRIGQETDAIFEYPLLGLDMEIEYFGRNINKRLSTTENLAVGEQSRDLIRSFADGVISESEFTDPYVGQGTGGKEMDKKMQSELSEYRKAVLTYHSNQKNRSKRSQREGNDYYATPEPVGQKMVEWLNLKTDESVMEPSAGHGAIAMWFPSWVNSTAIEPSFSLYSKLNAKAGGGDRKVLNTTFEEFNVVNKFNGIAMNPPFGSGGATAMAHIEKAFHHLKDGGRLVAIVPNGGSMQKRLDKFLFGEYDKGKRSNPDAVLVKEIILPGVTFEQAGTNVNCKVVIMDKIPVEQQRSSYSAQTDLTYAKNVEELFDSLEDISVPPRQQLAAEVQKVVESVPDPATKIQIEKTTHTKTGEDIFIAKMSERLEREQYNKLSNQARKNNGFWSSFSKGFLFKSEEDANKFAGAVNNGEVRFRANESIHEVNKQFNNELSGLNAENAQSVILRLGKPSDMLLSAGIPNKELRLYGNRLLKKSQKHGFDVNAVKNLPLALVEPLAVFRGEHPGRFAIITELEINGKNLLATIETDKNGEVDFNFISSVFGKENRGVIKWILDGKLLNVDKTKALNFVSASALNADATQNQELYSVTKIIENFENPTNPEAKIVTRTKNTLLRLNTQFNSELQQQIDGTLPKGHVYKLGNPSSILLSAGIPDLPIELAASTLSVKAAKDYVNAHPFDLMEIMNLPNAIQNPIAVFDSKTQTGSKVILTELKSNGSNFVVAMKVNTFPRGYRSNIQINDIRSIYPKDNVQDIVNWINRGDLLKWANKNKILNWITQQRSNSAEVAIPNKDFNVTINMHQFNSGEDIQPPKGSKSVEERRSQFSPKSSKDTAKDFNGTTQQQSNSADVAIPNKELLVATKILQKFNNPTIEEGKMIAEVENISQTLNTPVEVIRDVEQMPVSGDTILDQKKRGAKGYYDTATGKVVIILPNAESVEDVKRTMLHEIVAHHGLRELMGKEFDSFLDQVYEGVNPQIRSVIDNLVEKEGIDNREATEEYLAHLAEKGDYIKENRSLWDKIKEWFDNLLSKFGINVELSDNDLRYILRRSYDNLKGKGTIENKAKDVLLRKELGIGRTMFRKKEPRPEDFVTNNISLSWRESQMEKVVDRMISVKNIQDVVLGRGGKVGTHSNPYTTEFLSTSRAKNEIDLFMRDTYEPLMENVTKAEELFVQLGLSSKDDSYYDVCDYLYAKHAPERNRKICIDEIRDAAINGIPFSVLKASSEDLQKMISQYCTMAYDKKFAGKQGALNPLDVAKLPDLEMKILSQVMKQANKEVEDIAKSEHKNNRSGMTDEEAGEIINKFYNNGTAQVLNDLSGKVKAATNFTLDIWKKYSLISTEEYDAYKNMYANYIPLRNWEDMEDVDYASLPSKAFNRASEVVSLNKKAEGRYSKADDPLAYIASLAHTAAISGNKNLIRLNAFRMVVDNKDIMEDLAVIEKSYFIESPNGSIETFVRPAQELFDAGFVKTNFDKSYRWHKTYAQLTAHQVPVMINGQRHIITFKGDIGVKAAAAINNTNKKDFNNLVGKIGKTTRWISSNLTAKNPDFMLTNFARDYMFGNMAYFIEGGNVWKLNKNIKHAFKTIHNDFVGIDQNSADAKLYAEFKANGGQTGYIHMKDVKQLKKDIDILRRASKGEKNLADITLRNAPMELGAKTLEYLGLMSENAMRFAVYKTEREKGASAKEAAVKAKEITVNFNRMGTNTNSFSAFYAFFNPTVQGTYRLYNLSKKNPKRFFSTVGTVALMKFTAGLLSSLLARDDDEGVNEYDKLSDYVKFANIVILNPFSEKRNEFITIPMAQGIRGLTNISDQIIEVLRGNKTLTESSQVFFSNIISELSPVDVDAINITGKTPMESVLLAVSPTTVRPFVENMVNQNYLGAKIFREDFISTQEGITPEYKKVYKGTSRMFIGASRWLNSVAGGTDETSSAIQYNAKTGEVSKSVIGYFADFNPAKVEHVLEGFIGGRFRFFNDLYKTSYSLVTGDDVEINNLPVIHRLYKESFFRPGYKTYYEFREKVEDINALLKGFKRMGDYQSWRSVYSANVRLVTLYDIYSKQIKKMNDLINELPAGNARDALEKKRDERILQCSVKYNKIIKKHINEKN